MSPEPPNPESFRDQVERLISMSRDNGETWDLSVNDQAALKAVLQRMAVLDADSERLTADRDALQQQVKQLVGDVRAISADYSTAVAERDQAQQQVKALQAENERIRITFRNIDGFS
jgi:histidinol-phosphate/aromatic aminotransferase/cobyric acid decarboxylase-like protein